MLQTNCKSPNCVVMRATLHNNSAFKYVTRIIWRLKGKHGYPHKIKETQHSIHLITKQKRWVQLTCKPGKTALLIADSNSTPSTGSFLKKIMPPLGPLKDWREMPKFIRSCVCKMQITTKTAHDFQKIWYHAICSVYCQSKLSYYWNIKSWCKQGTLHYILN